MTFEEWKDCGTHNESPCRDMYEDWATDREELIAEKAEARKEGIDKMRDVAKLCNDTRRYPGTILSAQEFERWVDREIDKMAERLKKQG